MSTQQTVLGEACPPYPQPRPRLPTNFPTVLKEFTREVLRAQPHDILEWSAEYFKQLALLSDPSCRVQQAKTPQSDLNYAKAHATSPVATPVKEENGKGREEEEEEEVLTEEVLLLALASLDESHKGVISIQELRGVLSEHFKLSPVQYLFLITALPTTVTHQDDIIEYETFVKQCAFLLPFLQHIEQDFDSVVHQNPDVEIHGMNREDLEREFSNYFFELDKECKGVISWGEYCDAILDAPIPLTGRDVQIITLECKRYRSDYGEEVAYTEEIQHLFERLILSFYLNEFISKVIEGG
ncbi:unnamed protein product [Phytomonas sp. Hart1]|nr:unnamed protein product [Phytomonas sp. Hart1]|eukprot:CCW68918.1 unnamed protein product [Phytomonas sp. isolate Hart1]